MLTTFCSCTWFDASIKDFFKEYTETAAVIRHEYTESVNTDKYGTDCLSSGMDKEIYLYLRNPQHYTLEPTIISDYRDPSSGDKVSASSSTYNIAQEADKTVLRITLRDDFLTRLECGEVFSPTISLVEPKSGRQFEDYHFDLKINSIPPAPESAVVLVTVANPKKYVLCFNLPQKNDVKGIHRDIKNLILESNGSFGKTKFVLTPDTSGNFTITDERGGSTDIIKTSISDGEIIENTEQEGAAGLGFNAGENAVYVFTDDLLVPLTQNIYYTITIEDEDGLSASTSTSVYSQKLALPKATAVSSENMESVELNDTEVTEIIQNDNGAAYIKLICPARSTSGLSVSSCTVDYEIYGGTSFDTLLGKGSISSDKEIPLPPVECKVKTWAKNPSYVSSDFAWFHVKGECKKIYVSASGKEAGWGTKDNPYNKISTVFEKDLFTDNNSSENTIVLLSDISDENINIDSLHCFTLSGQNSNGNKEVHTITPSSAYSNFMSIDASSNIYVEDVCIKNFVSSSGGAAFAVKNANLTLNNVELNGNSGTNGGALYLSHKDSFVTLKGKSVVKSNTASVAGAGAYVGNKEAILSINDDSYFEQTDEIYLCPDALLYADALCTASKLACIKPPSYPEDPVVDKVRLLELTLNAIDYTIEEEAYSSFCNSRVTVADNPATPDLEYYVVYSDFDRAGILSKGTSANVQTKLPDKVIFHQLYMKGIYLTFYATDGSGNRLSPEKTRIKVKLRSDVLSSDTKDNGYVKLSIPGEIEDLIEDGKIEEDKVTVDLSIWISGIVYSATEDIVASSEITDAASLANAIDFINTLEDSTGRTIEISADITVTDSMPLLGTSDHKFNGTFDGKGHTITLNRSAKGRMAAIADYVGEKGVIKNVVIDGTYRNEPGGNNGLISGGVAVENDGLIINCVNYLNLKVKSTNDTGGIVGVNRGKVVNCANFGNISNERTPRWAMLCGLFGGIAGRSDGSSIIENCFNCGEMKSTQNSAFATAPNSLPAAITGNQAENARGYNCYWKDGCVIRNCGNDGAAYNSYTFKNSVASMFWTYKSIGSNGRVDISSKYGESFIYSCGTFANASSNIAAGNAENSERAQTLTYNGTLLKVMNDYVDGKSKKYMFDGQQIDLLNWEADAAHDGYPKLKSPTE